MTDRCLLGQHSFIPDWITATASCLYSLHSVSPICSERCGSANFQNSTIKTHYSCAHQPLLAARPRTYLVQTGSHDVSIHPAFRPTYSHVSPVLPTWHPDDGCGPLYFTSSGRSARSSLYSRQAGVSSFWCHRLEQPASSRRICAVTRGFQTTTQDLSVFQFLPRHYHMTRVLLSPFIITCLDTCGPCNN